MLYKEFEKNREDILENEFCMPLYVLLESVYKEMLK